MAKDFAFLFYVNDWAGGTQWLTRLQRGGYLDLLLYQVNNKCFTKEEVKNILGNDFDEIWGAIKDKFSEEEGKLFNSKMRDVLEKRAEFTESRRKNRLGKVKKQKKKTSKSLVKQVGIENEIENIILKDKYNVWLEYRINKKKPVSDDAKKEQIEFLKKYPVDVAVKIISDSIKNDWQGLFEPKEYKKQETLVPQGAGREKV